MSVDERRASDLVKTLEDGAEGYRSAAEKVDRPDVAARFVQFAGQRDKMADEIRGIAAAYGDDMPNDGTVAGAVHRGWMELKDMLTGSSDDAIFKAASTGEDHAVEQYQDAIADDDVSPGFKITLSRQLASIEAARTYVHSLL